LINEARINLLIFTFFWNKKHYWKIIRPVQCQKKKIRFLDEHLLSDFFIGDVKEKGQIGKWQQLFLS